MAWRPTLLRVMYLVITSTNARSNIKKRPKHRRIERGFSDERGQRCGDRAAQNRIFRAKPDCRLFARGILGRTDRPLRISSNQHVVVCNRTLHATASPKVSNVL